MQQNRKYQLHEINYAKYALQNMTKKIKLLNYYDNNKFYFAYHNAAIYVKVIY